MTIWRPGMLCVCIADRWEQSLDRAPSPNPPVKGRIYTVSAVRPVSFIGTVLNLAELDADQWWQANCFRPVQENRLDTLRALLNPTPTPARVREDA